MKISQRSLFLEQVTIDHNFNWKVWIKKSDNIKLLVFIHSACPYSLNAPNIISFLHPQTKYITVTLSNCMYEF